MEKLRSYIECWLTGKKVRGADVTPYEIRELIDSYKRLLRKEQPEFISGKVKEVLDRCGIYTIESGIGWKIAQKGGR